MLGGYGKIGSELCEAILEEPNTIVIIAGRRTNKAEELSAKLKKNFPIERILFRYADVSNLESLIKAFQDVDLVVVATNTPLWTEQIAIAADKADGDYMDVSSDIDNINSINVLEKITDKSRRLFVVRASFYHSLPSILIRCGEKYFDRCDKANIFFGIKGQKYNKGVVKELFESFSSVKGEIAPNDECAKSDLKDSRIIYLPPPHGFQKFWRTNIVDYPSSSEKTCFKERGVYATHFSWFGNHFLVPLIIMSKNIKSIYILSLWKRMLIWLSGLLSGRDDLVYISLVAEGEKDSNYRKLIISLEIPSYFEFNKIIFMAVIRQYLDKIILNQGLCVIGNHIDIDRFLIDVENLGVKVRTMLAEDIRA